MEYQHPILSLEAWQPVDPLDALEYMKKDFRERREGLGGGDRASSWQNDGSLAPINVYCYLKSRFGRPNGTSMALREASSDNLIQWHYTITANDETLHVFGTNSALDLVVRTARPFNTRHWSRLIEALKSEIAKQARELATVRAALEKWTLFTNPYRRIEEIVFDLADRLESLDLSEPQVSISKRGRIKNDDLFMRWLKNVKEASILGASLRMLAPVMVEAAVNLLIYALARPEIKKDKRTYDFLLRSNIDVRVKMLPLTCIGFKRGLDADADEFKSFHSLMNKRNEFLHGSVKPEELEIGEVFFDDTIPIFHDDQSLIRRFTKGSLRQVAPIDALADLEAAGRFIAFLLDHLKDEVRGQIELLMLSRELGLRKGSEKIGILFGRNLAESWLPGRKYS